MTKQLKKIFGIDLGTTYSSIAYVDEHGKPIVVPNSENQNITPSVVFFDEGNVVVGDVAKESSKIYPNEVVSFIKRSIGEQDFIFENNKTNYRPEEISSYILRKLTQDAQSYLGEKVTDVVITCPAYFGINEREATKKAGEIAGLNVHQIINEPTAAAINYGAVQPSAKKNVLVYDLGGGTFDITMINISPEAIKVICTGGDHNLGGKDWDDRIVGYFVQKFQDITNTTEDILEDPDTCQELQLIAEKTKKLLSTRKKIPVSISHGGQRVKTELEREKFIEITQDLLERTVTFTKEMLQNAKKKGYDKYDEIILVGGSTRMPQVAEKLRIAFNVTPKVFDPDEAVVKGAAIFGWKLSVNDELVKMVSEKKDENANKTANIKDGIDADTGADDDDGEIVLELDNSDEPDEAEQLEQLAIETGYTLGALESSQVDIQNVTSKSFGIVVRDSEDKDIVFNVIKRNVVVPAKAKKIFYTAVKDQETVLIRIMECESDDEVVEMVNAIQIGNAILALPDGLPVDLPIEITFELNGEGRLIITALETSKNKSINVEITTNAVISGEDLKKAKSRSQSLVIH